MMAKVVLGKQEKFDLRATLVEVLQVELADDIVANKELTYILTDTEENLQVIENGENELYIPARLLTSEYQKLAHVQVYFDLENYSFYQKAKDIIESSEKPQGVFRFRRTIKQTVNEAFIAEDLYVLTSLLGEPVDVQVRQTDHSITPTHIILMINFGGGTMAHLEYTFTQTDQEKVELEWSGVKNIIEFDSEVLNPVQTENQRNLSLI